MHLRIGTCQLCGEPGVKLYAFEDLPEEFEGVSCMRCGEFHEDEAERQHQRHLARREARRDI